jgi:glyoxylase-like metal-dependent hydrolase (beta-lactamase superfamily II)
MEIKRVVFNPFRENTYLVWDATKEAIVVDAGNMSEAENAMLKEIITSLELKPVMAVNTHGHFDHTQGVKWLKEEYGVKFACSSKDKFLIEASSGGVVYGLKCNEVPEIDIDLDAADKITFGDTELRIIKTPGHTPGHVVLFNEAEKVLFTGDTLFQDSIGRTDFPTGDIAAMRQSLRRLAALEGDFVVYPGHNEETTLQRERSCNPFLRDA